MSSPDFKHCVLSALRWRVKGKGYCDDYLMRIAVAGNQEFADKVKEEAARQWGLGNRGLNGDWRE